MSNLGDVLDKRQMFAERLRRDNPDGCRCRIISQGDKCKCLLCEMDELLNAVQRLGPVLLDNGEEQLLSLAPKPTSGDAAKNGTSNQHVLSDVELNAVARLRVGVSMLRWDNHTQAYHLTNEGTEVIRLAKAICTGEPVKE